MHQYSIHLHNLGNWLTEGVFVFGGWSVLYIRTSYDNPKTFHHIHQNKYFTIKICIHICILFFVTC